MKYSICAIITSAAAALAALLFPGEAAAGSPGDAKAPSVEVSSQVWTQPLLGVGVKSSDVYTDGHIFVTVPIWSTIGRDSTLGGDYIFLEPYSSLGESGEVTTSLGLSWRHLFSNESVSALQKQGQAGFLEEGWFVGGNVFLDMLDTQHNNQFWQMGVGAEVGTRYFEVRGNYYIPMTGEQLYDRSVSTQTFSSSSTSLSTQNSYGNLFATGNSILQPFSTRTSATTTTRTTSVRTVTELFEKGMEGWDAEASILVPWVDQWMDLRLSGGYLSFNNQPFGPQDGPTGPVHGWKAGIDLRPVPAVVLGATWFEDKRFAGSNWVFSAELQIPLDKTWKDAFKMRRRHLVEHVAEPVHRQNDAIKVGNREEQQSTSSTKVRRVTKVVSQSSTNLVLKDDIIFVNNGGPVGNGIQTGNDATGTGTAEQPKATIQQGALVAQGNSNATARIWNVYTQGTTAGYTENVTTNVGSVNFIGSGELIVGQGGKSFGTGPAPAVKGGFLATNIPYFGIHAYQISGGNPTNNDHGIDVLNVTTVIVRNSTISDIPGAGDGVRVQADDGQLTPGTVLISGNTFTNITNFNSVDIRTFSSSTLTALVTGNDFHTAGTDYVHSESHHTSTLNITTTGNSFHSAVGDAIHSEAHEDSKGSSIATGNLIVGQGANGIHFITDGGATLTALVTGNTILNSATNGILLESNNNTATNGITGTVSGNTVINSDANGIQLSTSNTAFAVINVDANIINQTAFAGIALFTSNSTVGTGLIATVSRNTVSNTGTQGIYANTLDSGIQDLTINSNNVSNTSFGSAGISIVATNAVSNTGITATVTGNSVTNAGSSAILGQAENSGSLFITATGNTLTKTALGFDGFGILSRDDGLVEATINNNYVFNLIGNSAINAQSFDASNLTITASNNIFDNSNRGVFLESFGTTKLTAILDNNTITRMAFEGMQIASRDQSILNVNSLSNNIISGKGGLDFDAGNTSTINANAVNTNIITSLGTNPGIDATIRNSATINLTATNNQILEDAPTHLPQGVRLTIESGTGIINATLTSNTITSPTNDGIFAENKSTGAGGSLTVRITSNQISGAGDNGVFINSSVALNPTHLFINGNTISGANGINLSAPAAGTFDLNVATILTNNVITGSVGDSLNVSDPGPVMTNTSSIQINGGAPISPPVTTP